MYIYLYKTIPEVKLANYSQKYGQNKLLCRVRSDTVFVLVFSAFIKFVL